MSFISIITSSSYVHTTALKALESDTRVLAYEAGRKYKVRVNTISAGPLGSRAAKAIGFIDDMIKSVGAGAHRACWLSNGCLGRGMCRHYTINFEPNPAWVTMGTNQEGPWI